jgi:hypothetical protein
MTSSVDKRSEIVINTMQTVIGQLHFQIACLQADLHIANETLAARAEPAKGDLKVVPNK